MAAAKKGWRVGARASNPAQRFNPTAGRKHLMLQIAAQDLGTLSYEAARAMQIERAEVVERGGGDGFLLVVEHPPVLTMGRRADPAELGLSQDEWRARGVDIQATERGGRITYHGPGQLVAYPIVNLRRLGCDLPAYVHSLEQVAIDLAAGYGIDAWRDPEHVGVWTCQGKLAAVGVHVRRWVATHGLAVNVNNALDVYRCFTPCGIANRGVTSLAYLLGHPVAMREARERLSACFAQVFQAHLVWTDTGWGGNRT